MNALHTTRLLHDTQDEVIRLHGRIVDLEEENARLRADVVGVAMSELAHVCELALGSGIESVNSFGLLLTARIALLSDGRTEPYTADDVDMQPLIKFGRGLNDSSDANPPISTDKQERRTN